jgi:hypothetical protein
MQSKEFNPQEGNIKTSQNTKHEGIQREYKQTTGPTKPKINEIHENSSIYITIGIII